MNYTLNQLQIFQKVVETKSITRAAEELHLTQPAVSIQLKNFQDQFKIPLTEVIGRQLYVTDFGLEIAECAENILNQAYAINYKTLAYKGQLTGKLKIAIVSTGKYVMPFFLADFMKRHDGIELIMDVTNKTKVLENLEKNEIDFALVSILPKNIEIMKLDLLSNKLYLVGNTNQKPTKTTMDKSFFKDIPLIFREKGSGTRAMMESFIEKQNISVINKMELTSNEAVKQAILAGLGYSIMPLIGIKNELQSKELRIIPTKGLPLKTTWSLIWLKRKKHSPVAEAFLESIKSRKNDIVNAHFGWHEK